MSLDDTLNGIKFGQDSEGNWGYITPGADTVNPFKSGGGYEVVTLWTNPSPSARFTARTISLNLSDYYGVVVHGKSALDYPGSIGYTFGYVTNSSTNCVLAGGIAYRTRAFTVSKTGITFGSGCYCGNVSAECDDNGIPLTIYGIKK